MSTLGETTKQGKPYLSIIGGRLKKKVTEDTPGAIKREYEDSKGNKGVKFELEYKDISGRIEDLRFKNSDFGENLEIEFDDFILSISVESKYFKDFAKKILSADINAPVKIAPYDFEADGKKLSGVTIYQGAKLENFFWDASKGAYSDKYPKFEGAWETASKKDKTLYFLAVEDFLKEAIAVAKASINADVSSEGEQPEPEEEFPVITQEQVNSGMKQEPLIVDGQSVPF